MKRPLELDTTHHGDEDACEREFKPKRARQSLQDTVVSLNGSLAQSLPRTAVDQMGPLLQTIPRLAVEIQLEIYQYLRPQDLYNLSLASKPFRAFFWANSNASLWDATFARTEGMPERPSWMTIPAFVRFLCSPCCDNCGKLRADEVVWVVFKRFCRGCLPKVTGSKGMDLAFMSELEVAYSQSPCPFNYYKIPSRGGLYMKNVWLKTELLEFEEEYLQVRTQIRFGTWQEQKAFIARMERRNKERKEFSKRWSQFVKHDHEDVRISRIVERVKIDGWGPEIDFLGQRGIKEMCSIYALQNTTSITTLIDIPQDLHKFLRDTRASRLHQGRRPELQARFAQLNAAVIGLVKRKNPVPTKGATDNNGPWELFERSQRTESRPHFIDFALAPPCRALLEAPEANYSPLVTLLPTLYDEWEVARKAELTALVLARIGADTVPADILPLDLAMGFLMCAGPCGGTLLHWPNAMAHGCARRGALPTDADTYTEAACAFAADPGLRGRTWDAEWIGACKPFDPRCFEDEKTNEHASRVMCAIMEAMGLDAARATVRDLQGSKVFLWCGTCQKNGAGLEDRVYGWEAAFFHAAAHMKRGLSGGHQTWIPVPREESSKIRHLEQSEIEKRTDRDPSLGRTIVWSCKRCFEWDGHWDAMRYHLEKEHGLTKNPVLGMESLRTSSVYINAGLSKFNQFTVPHAPYITFHGIAEYYREYP